MPNPNEKPEVVLTVFFGNTAHQVNTGARKPTKDGLRKVYGSDVIFKGIQDDKNQYAIAFDGAYIRNKVTGGLFGVGLDGQLRHVEKIVEKLVKEGKKVIVNCYGESRGGVAAFLAAKNLSRYSDTQVETNLAVLDPVPGNSLMGRFLDFFNLSLTNQTLDLSTCDNLKNVLAIYNTGNAPFHTAISPIYPKKCKVREEVAVGNHVLFSDWDTYAGDLKVEPIFEGIKDFLQKCKTGFKEKSIQIRKNSLFRNLSSKRPYIPLHSLKDEEIALTKLPRDDEYDKGEIKPNNSIFETIIFPSLLTALKWIMLGAAIGALLYFTGGLAAIPFIGNIGALAIPLILPITTLIGRVLSPLFNAIASGISRVGYYLFQQDDPGVRNNTLNKLSIEKSFFEKIQPYVHFTLRALAFGVTVAGILYLTGGLAAIPLLGALAKGLSIVATGSAIGGIGASIYAFAKNIFKLCRPSNKVAPQEPVSISLDAVRRSSDTRISDGLPKTTRRSLSISVEEEKEITLNHSPSFTEKEETAEATLGRAESPSLSLK